VGRGKEWGDGGRVGRVAGGGERGGVPREGRLKREGVRRWKGWREGVEEKWGESVLIAERES